MKKKACFLSFLLGLIVLLSAGPVQADPYAYMSPTSIVATQGTTFSIDIWASNDILEGELLSFAFEVFPDTSFFSWTGYDLAPEFDDDNYMFGDPDPIFGPNYVAGSTFVGVTGSDINLATLYFSADAVDSGHLLIAGLVDPWFDGLGFYNPAVGGDPFAANTFFDVFFEIDVEVKPVPEPTTMLLFGTGLLGLAGIRRRKSKRS